MEISLEGVLLKAGIAIGGGAGLYSAGKAYQWAYDLANSGDSASAIFVSCFTTACAMIITSPFVAYLVEKYRNSHKISSNQKV